MSHIDPSLNLASAVAINESLKQVIEISRQINLVAINAILVAKRAGDDSAGFRVVAIELRSFSEKVEKMMFALGALIAQLVKRIAAMLKLARSVRIMADTLQKSGDQNAILQANYASKQAAYASNRVSCEKDWAQLGKELGRSLLLCKSGSMLSHNGRIEAAYGGAMLSDMLQVASQIETIMGRAIDELMLLNANLKT